MHRQDCIDKLIFVFVDSIPGKIRIREIPYAKFIRWISTYIFIV
jgi:hypothetical protein